MVELGLVFTVIAVAIAGVLYAYNSVMTSYKYQKLVNIVQQGIAGIYEFNQDTSNKVCTPSMMTLYNEGYLSIKPNNSGVTYQNPLGGVIIFGYSVKEPIFSKPGNLGITVVFGVADDLKSYNPTQCDRFYSMMTKTMSASEWKINNSCHPSSGEVPSMELENK